jgi:hypothetical protein
VAINWQEGKLDGTLEVSEATDARERSDEAGHPLGEARPLAPGTYVVRRHLQGASIVKPTEAGHIGSVGSEYYGVEVDGKIVFVAAARGTFTAGS